jgi:hypothetical protein
MKADVLLDDMLWWLVHKEILGECTACSFSIQQACVCNIHEDLNLQFMEKGIV